jgi:hypothetical protein
MLTVTTQLLVPTAQAQHSEMLLLVLLLLCASTKTVGSM